MCHVKRPGGHMVNCVPAGATGGSGGGQVGAGLAQIHFGKHSQTNCKLSSLV